MKRHLNSNLTLLAATLLIAGTSAVVTTPALALGPSRPSYLCFFSVPTVHVGQTGTPYRGKGRTLLEARARAVAKCKSELSSIMSNGGTWCDYYLQPEYMECEAVGQRFPSADQE